MKVIGIILIALGNRVIYIPGRQDWRERKNIGRSSPEKGCRLKTVTLLSYS